MRRVLLLLAGVLLLAACAPTRPVFPPAASVQEIRALPDGRWRVILRLQNYALRSLRFSAVDLALTVGAQPAGRLQKPIDLDIAETSSDVVELTLVPGASARAALAADRSGNIAYSLAGSVQAGPTAGDQRRFRIAHHGYLSPVPGLPGAWR